MSTSFNPGHFVSKVTYTNSEFMLAWNYVRAWFTAHGELKDAEFKRWDNGTLKCYPVQARHTRIRAWLEERGKVEAATSRHVRDVMKTIMENDDMRERSEKKKIVVEGLKVGHMVRCPADRGQAAYDGIVEEIGCLVRKNVEGVAYVWVMVRRNTGNAALWPSNRLGGRVIA